MSTPAWPPVRAPGKVFLAGEYGVLVGGPALVMAVRRFARLAGTHDRPATPFEREGLARLEAAGVTLPGGLPTVEAAELRDAGGVKLGLGSSAAWSAAVTLSALLAGRRPEAASPEACWPLAHAVHGGGSGADVASCLAGGVIRFERRPGEAHATIERRDLPGASLPLVIHGGRAVSTARTLSALRGEEHQRLLEEAARVGAALCEALLAGDPAGIREGVRESAARIEALGGAAGLGEDTGSEVVAAVDRALRPFGGAAKPSGASGAELVLAYVPGVESDDRDAVSRRLSEQGLQVLDLPVAPDGAAPLEPTTITDP
ncbi:MAG: hypothetical protein P1V51_14415 [Deltaproteobacteria bacterium]|nr:hypothetical protein [Deltaproteobacteria bacterium]